MFKKMSLDIYIEVPDAVLLTNGMIAIDSLMDECSDAIKALKENDTQVLKIMMGMQVISSIYTPTEYMDCVRVKNLPKKKAI